MKAEDTNNFRKAMGKKIKSFRDADIFKLILFQNKSQYKSLISVI